MSEYKFCKHGHPDGYCNDCIIEHLTSENLALQQRVKELQNLFEEFAQHKPLCQCKMVSMDKCDCGLEQAYAQVYKEQEGVK